jgi:hypothetical protein
MASPVEPGPGLPKVEERDLLDLVFDDLLDPHSLGRWKSFADTNPELAREIIIRSIQDIRQMPEHPSGAEIRKFGIDLVTFAMAALEKAHSRERRIQVANTDIPPLTPA